MQIRVKRAKFISNTLFSFMLTFKWILLVLTLLWKQLRFLPVWEGYAIHKGRCPTLRTNFLEHVYCVGYTLLVIDPVFRKTSRGIWGKHRLQIQEEILDICAHCWLNVLGKVCFYWEIWFITNSSLTCIDGVSDEANGVYKLECWSRPYCPRLKFALQDITDLAAESKA